MRSMARDWRCVLRLHKYREKHNDLNEVYWECARCGDMKFPIKFPTTEGEGPRWPPGTAGGGSGPSAG
jgi:hypothetical protein